MMTRKDIPEMVRLAKDLSSATERVKGFYLIESLDQIATHQSPEALIAALQTMFDLGYAHGVKTSQVKRN